MKREPGFYWVKYNWNWIIGEFDGISWYFCDPMLDYPEGREDEYLEEIDERRIERISEPDCVIGEHDYTATDKDGFTICKKCGLGYT